MSVYAASVPPPPSRTRSVWLMARVSHVPAMPAAVQAAGGVQQVVVTGARLTKVMEAMTSTAPRSTLQNSPVLVPAELK